MSARNLKRNVALSLGVVALLFLPITIGPLDRGGDAGFDSLLRTSEACAQGHGCFWDPAGEPPCPDNPPPWYCNFGCVG